MLFVLPLRNLPLTFVPSPPPPPPPPPRAGGEGAGARADLGPELGLDHQLVHRLRPADDDPVLLAAAARCPQDFLHRARIDVLAAHDEHVVHAPVDSPRQPRVGAPALAGLVRPGREVPRPEPDHGLGGALQVGVDGNALFPEPHERLALGVEELGIDDVLPEGHAGPDLALGVGHPGPHSGPGAEGEGRGPQALDAGHRPPAAKVEAEERAEEDRIRGPEAEAPHDPRVRVGDAAPVIPADGEGGGLPGGARGPVDAAHLLAGDAEVRAQRRVRGLVLPELLLRHDGDLTEVVEALDVAGLEPRALPFSPVERRALPGPGHGGLGLPENLSVARLWILALPLREPVAGV